MKALEKDRNRRYDSASALAADVQRFLDDEPVQACPPSVHYRLRKFARRNKVRLVVSLCIVVAVVGVLMVPVSWSLAKRRRTETTLRVVEEKLTAAMTALETRDLLKAEQSMEAAKAILAAGDSNFPQMAERLETLQAELSSHKGDSEDFLKFTSLARDAQTQMGYDISLGGEKTGREALAIYAVLTSPNWRRQLDQRRLTSEQKQLVLETCYETLLVLADSLIRWNHKVEDPSERVQRLKSSMEALQTAQAFHEPTRAFYWIRAQYHRTLEDWKAADLDQKQFEALPARKPLDHYLPGHTAGWQGDLDQAIRSYEAALRLQPNHYNSLFFLGERLAASNRHSEAIGYASACIALRSDHVFAHLNRGEYNWKLGRLEEAEADYSAAIQVAQTTTERLFAYNERHDFYQSVGRTNDAPLDLDRYIALSRQNLESQRASLGPEHVETLSTMAYLGYALLRQQQYDDAEPLLRECLAASERNQPDAWTTFNRKSLLGGALLGQARALKICNPAAAEQKLFEAEPLLKTGCAVLKAREANIRRGKIRLTDAIERLVGLYSEWDKQDEAIRWRKELEDIQPKPRGPADSQPPTSKP
jgi:tetratricopeptide (TPR) repeat protein